MPVSPTAGFSSLYGHHSAILFRLQPLSSPVFKESSCPPTNEEAAEVAAWKTRMAATTGESREVLILRKWDQPSLKRPKRVFHSSATQQRLLWLDKNQCDTDSRCIFTHRLPLLYCERQKNDERFHVSYIGLGSVRYRRLGIANMPGGY